MKKGKWSKEEDNLIKNHIEKYGIGRSWQALSNNLGLQRCGRSCRSRWLNYLRPGLKHGNFTPAEERIICEMYSKRGSCWSIIAAQLPGRTDLAIKNYWNSTLKKRFPAARGGAARRRHLPAASTSSDAATPDLALVVYSEESTRTGSSSHTGVDKPVLAGSPSVQVQPPPAGAGGSAANEKPISAVPISGPVRTEQKPAVGSLPLEKALPPPPPSGDQTGEMDITCAPMSPLPLAFMEPELAFMTDFDDIYSFLPWFDD